jgi:hypothetical protein
MRGVHFWDTLQYCDWLLVVESIATAVESWSNISLKNDAMSENFGLFFGSSSQHSSITE